MELDLTIDPPSAPDHGFYVFARFVGPHGDYWRAWTGPRGGNPASTAPLDHPAVAWFADRTAAKNALRNVFGDLAEAKAWGLEIAPAKVVIQHAQMSPSSS